MNLPKGPFNDLYFKIDDILRGTFTGVNTMEGMPSTDQFDELPILFYEITDIEKKKRTGSGEFDLACDLEIGIVLSSKMKHSQLRARNSAVRIADLFESKYLTNNQTTEINYIRSRDWGLDLLTNNAIEAWSSVFTLDIRVGASIWDEWDTYYENVKYDEGKNDV